MRPILVGLHNPHSSHPSDALHPLPIGASGSRLFSMIKEYARDMTVQDYLDGFDRKNLVAGLGIYLDTSVPAKVMLETLPKNATVVMLGTGVAWAFRKALQIREQFPLIHPRVADGITWRMIPHPSGRSTLYNDPTMRALVGMMLADLYRLGAREYNAT